MDRLRSRPISRRRVSRRAQNLISTIWIVAALALPVVGVVTITQSVSPLAGDAESVTYTVRSGDTLSTIARRYGVTVEAIMQANGLANPHVIYAGQTLIIPQDVPENNGQIHTVQQGETLSAIAYRYSVPVDAIVQANNLVSVNDIRAGQKLTIPDVDYTPVESIAYTVQRGDSIYRIALMFGVDVDEILATNSLAGPNAIYPGIVLRIPAPASTVATEAGNVSGSSGGRTHFVQAGQTLSEIAVSYGVTVDGIVAANDLGQPDHIYPGQLLNIPEAGAAARAYPAQTAVTHRVKAGETLSQIALRYGVTLHALTAANNISNPARVAAGTVLSIPSATAGSNSVAYATAGAGLCSGVDPDRTGTGYFMRPVRGYVFTQRFHGAHAGVDLAADVGVTTYASDSGTVVYAGWNNYGYGNLIVLDHGNGWRSYYAHLSAVHVTCGEWIPRGAIIGKVGSTGNSTGPHLHFELLRYGIAVNPAGYIRF